MREYTGYAIGNMIIRLNVEDEENPISFDQLSLDGFSEHSDMFSQPMDKEDVTNLIGFLQHSIKQIKSHSRRGGKRKK